MWSKNEEYQGGALYTLNDLLPHEKA